MQLSTQWCTRGATSFVALVLIFAAAAMPAWSRGSAPAESRSVPALTLSELPAEAQHTVRLIRKGGPFPYQRDDVVFGNFERALPARSRGYYREYTVPTPGLGHRGARRIVAGRNGELYYTDDHYRSFKRIRK